MARVLGRPLQTVNQILNGRKRITEQTAVELAVAFGTSPELWLNLETGYRLSLVRRTKYQAIARSAAKLLGTWTESVFAGGMMRRTSNSSRGLTTAAWAKSFGISTDPTPPAVRQYAERYPFTAREVATRALVLQGVAAVASGVDPAPVIEWFEDQSVWEAASPRERAFLLDPAAASSGQRLAFRWQQEAEWALLWVVGTVEALGLPTRQCDTRRLVDELIPALGSDVEPFLASARLRPQGVLLAEEDRHYDLWCRYVQTSRRDPQRLPIDLVYQVLYRREYVFEWLDGLDAWDEVTCDA